MMTTTTMITATTTTATTTPTMMMTGKPDGLEAVLTTNKIYSVKPINRLERLTGYWIKQRRGLS